MFLSACILTGCDYAPKINRIGLLSFIKYINIIVYYYNKYIIINY